MTELRQLEDDRPSAAQGSLLDHSELVKKIKWAKSTAAEIQHKAVTIELFLTT